MIYEKVFHQVCCMYVQTRTWIRKKHNNIGGGGGDGSGGHHILFFLFYGGYEFEFNQIEPLIEWRPD